MCVCVCVCVCVFILPEGRHAMLLQYVNMYAETGYLPRQFETQTLQICRNKP